MRILYGPIAKIFGGGAKPRAPVVPTPADSAARERKAQQEAEQKERARAQARQGQRTTLLTPTGAGAQFANVGQSGRRTLLGGPRQSG